MFKFCQNAAPGSDTNVIHFKNNPMKNFNEKATEIIREYLIENIKSRNDKIRFAEDLEISVTTIRYIIENQRNAGLDLWYRFCVYAEICPTCILE